jgi:hypothetical protein
MTQRERALLREAAVLGYVIGATHGPYREGIPKDSAIVAEVLEAAECSFPDLYPLLAALTDS